MRSLLCAALVLPLVGCLSDGRPYEDYLARLPPTPLDTAGYVPPTPLGCSEPGGAGVQLQILNETGFDYILVFLVAEDCSTQQIGSVPSTGALRPAAAVGQVFRFTHGGRPDYVFSEYRVTDDAEQQVIVQ